MMFWLLAGCPVFSWNEPTLLGETADTSVETVASTGETSETGVEPGSTGETGVPEEICRFSAFAGGAGTQFETAIARDIAVEGTIAAPGGRLAYYNGSRDLVTGSFDGANWVESVEFSSPSWPPYFQWLMATPSVDNDGEEDLAMLSNASIFIGPLGDPDLDQVSFSRALSPGYQACQSSDPGGPENAVVVGEDLFGDAGGVDILVACPMTGGDLDIIGFNIPVGGGGYAEQQTIYNMGFFVSGVSESGPGMLDYYDGATPGVVVAQPGDVAVGNSCAGEGARWTLLPRVAAGWPVDIRLNTPVPLVVDSGSCPSDFNGVLPVVMAEDVNSDGAPDLVGLLPVPGDGGLLVDSPMELLFFTNVEEVVDREGDATAIDAPVRVQVEGGTFTRPVHFLDQPGTQSDAVVVGVFRAGTGRSIAVLPATLPAGVHALEDVQWASIDGADPWFGENALGAGDVDGDGCNDLAIHTSSEPIQGTQYGVGTISIWSGR